MSRVYDDRVCALGEGPLWHPTRQQFFWFDIVGNRLLSHTDAGPQEWLFDENVSAAGWVDDDTLVIASETGLWRFSLDDGASQLVVPLEADNPVTRSNDGRADPWGGFWIGTMGKNAEADAGAIYRFYRGELRQLYQPIAISNAMCFSPDRRFAYFTDTLTKLVMRQPLAADDGWPVGAAEVYLDLRTEGLNPDGAVIDAAGNMWVAQWGACRIAVYAPDSTFIKSVKFDALQTSCPAFGGADLTTLYCTTAAVGLKTATLEKHPSNGMTFLSENAGKGQAEHQVIL
jgi:sugar lactone lactonase YvrE